MGGKGPGDGLDRTHKIIRRDDQKRQGPVGTPAGDPQGPSGRKRGSGFRGGCGGGSGGGGGTRGRGPRPWVDCRKRMGALQFFGLCPPD